MIFGAGQSGGSTFEFPMNGILDDVKFYNGVLTDTEILAEYNNTVACASTTCVPVVSSNGPICSGQNLLLQSTNAATYSWAGPNGFVSTDQNPTISNISATGSGIYTLTVTNGLACTGTATTEVTVHSGAICEGLLAHYKLDGNANDASGNDLHGTINGTLTGTTDRFGITNGAMHFNGSSHIIVSDNFILKPKNITISLWVKAPSNGFQSFAGKVYGNCSSNSLTRFTGISLSKPLVPK